MTLLTDRFVKLVESIDDTSRAGLEKLDALYDLVDDAIGATDEIGRLLGRDVPTRECFGFQAIDAGIALLDPGKISIRAIVGVLTITHTRRELLPSRAEFLKNSEDTLRAREPERVDALLRGFA